MPPRTGPRRKRRPKPSPPPAALRLAIIRADETTDLVLAYQLELEDRCLVLRDQAGGIVHIIADGEWREIRPAEVTRGASPADRAADYSGVSGIIGDSPAVTSGTIPFADEADPDKAEDRAPPPAAPPPRTSRAVNSAIVEVDTVLAPIREEAENRAVTSATERFVPSSPEDAQRVLRELHRRLAPDYQDPPEEAPPPAPPKGAP